MKIKMTIYDDGCDKVTVEVERYNTPEKKDRPHVSQYARFFDDGCIGWTKDAGYNLAFLCNQQAFANDMLKTRGHLFLNEVYDMLGIRRSKEGAVIGWVYDETNPVGDNCVDFGIYDQRNADFVNGHERSVLLDFNVDGNILEKI